MSSNKMSHCPHSLPRLAPYVPIARMVVVYRIETNNRKCRNGSYHWAYEAKCRIVILALIRLSRPAKLTLTGDGSTQSRQAGNAAIRSDGWHLVADKN